MFRFIEPEVAGGLGKATQLDVSVHPSLVKKLNYEFSGWLGDDILESFPCYIVSEQLKKKIEDKGLTGISFDNALITKSSEFEDLYPDLQLPIFFWAKSRV